MVFESIFVKAGTNPAGGPDYFGVRIITYVNEANLVVFPIASAGGGLVLVLEPMSADYVGISQGTADVTFVFIGAVLLVGCFLYVPT